MKHTVQITIPATITLRGKVEANTPEEAEAVALQEAERIREDFAASPILSGVWPERLGKASVAARPSSEGAVEVEVGA